MTFRSPSSGKRVVSVGSRAIARRRRGSGAGLRGTTANYREIAECRVPPSRIVEALDEVEDRDGGHCWFRSDDLELTRAQKGAPSTARNSDSSMSQSRAPRTRRRQRLDTADQRRDPAGPYCLLSDRGASSARSRASRISRISVSSMVRRLSLPPTSRPRCRRTGRPPGRRAPSARRVARCRVGGAPVPSGCPGCPRRVARSGRPARISWAVMRTCVPARSTEPSITPSTSSSRAISRSGLCTPLYCMARGACLSTSRSS